MEALTRQWWRVGGLCGIGLIIAAVIVAIVQGEPPTHDDPVEDIRAWWEDNGQAYLVGSYITGLAFFLLYIPFLVSVRTLLRRAEGGVEVLSTIALIGGLLVVAFVPAGAASWTALAFGAEHLSDDALVTLMYLDVGAFHIFTLAIGLFVLAASLVIATTGVVWRWVGYLGIIVAIAAFIGPLGILDDDPEDVLDIIGFVGAFLGWAIWALLLSVAMIRMTEEPKAAEATAMA
jgi:hypothetical protein